MSNEQEIDIYAEMAAQAVAITETEVVTWSPLVKGDHCCGRVIDTGTIELPSLRNPGEIDVWPTNTISPIGEITMDGKTLDASNIVLRVAWLGPVQLRYYHTNTPDIDDVIAMHYQTDQTPKSGLNDYKIVNCIVIDHTTQKVKRPREIAMRTVTGQLVDPASGELLGGAQLPSMEQFRERNRPVVEVHEPFADDDTAPPPPPPGGKAKGAAPTS